MISEQYFESCCDNKRYYTLLSGTPVYKCSKCNKALKIITNNMYDPLTTLKNVKEVSYTSGDNTYKLNKILEWLYLNDRTLGSAREWREKFIEMLKETI